MAITFLAAKAVGFAGTNSNTTVTLTSGWTQGTSNYTPVAGDLVVVAYAVGAAGSVTLSMVTSGYTEVAALSANDTEDAHLTVWYKFMESTPDTSVVVGGTGGTANGGALAVSVFSGVHPSTPMDVTRAFDTGINTHLPTFPSITPTTSGARVVVIGAGAHTATGAAYTQSGSQLSNFVSDFGADTQDGIVGMGWASWTSGAFNPTAWTGGGSVSTSNSWCACVMALRPEPAPIWSTSATQNIDENATLAVSLAASFADSYSIVGGADQAKFEISGTTLRWASNGTKDFEAPDDADTNNVYVVTVRAAGDGGNTDRTFNVTVNNVADTAPTWVTSATQNVNENATLAITLDATDASSYSIFGGADQARFEISSGVLRWASNGTKDFESPDDANTDNVYVVTVRATNAFGDTDRTFNVTVNDIPAPTITNSDTVLVPLPDDSFDLSLTADVAGGTWTKTGGADQAEFTLSGGAFPMLTWDSPTEGSKVVEVTYTTDEGQDVQEITFEGVNATWTSWRFPTFVGQYQEFAGDAPWTNPSNVTADDGSNASVDTAEDSGLGSFVLCAEDFDFDAEVPSGAVIIGVEVEIQGVASSIAEPGRFFRVQLLNDPNATPSPLDLIGSNRANSTVIQANDTLTEYVFGSSSDHWGAALTDAIVRGAGFGVGFSVEADIGNHLLFQADYVRMRVNYAAASSALEGEAALAGAGTQVADPALVAKGVSAMAGTGTQAADPALVAKGASVLNGTGTQAADPALRAKGATVLAGTGTQAADPALRAKGATVLAGTGTLTSVAGLVKLAAAAFAGTGTIAAAAELTDDAATALAGSGSLSADPALVAKGAIALAGTGTLAAEAFRVRIAEATLNGVGTLAADEDLVAKGASLLSGAGSLVADPALRANGASLLSGAGTFTADEDLVAKGASALNGTGTLAAAAEVNKLASATLAGAGTLAASAALRKTGAAILSGSGVLVADEDLIAQGVVALNGSGSLSVTPRLIRPGAAAFTGAGTLAADGDIGLFGQAVLSGAGMFTADQDLIAKGTSLLAGTGSIAADPALRAKGASLLAGVGSQVADSALVAKGVSAMAGAGTLAAEGDVGGGASADLAGTGSLTVVGRLLFQQTKVFSGTGTFSVDEDLTAKGTSVLAGASTLSADPALTAKAVVAFAGTGTLAAEGDVGGEARADLSGTGSIVVVAHLLIQQTKLFSGAGTLSVDEDLTAKGAAALNGTGTLAVIPSLFRKGVSAMAGTGTLAVDEDLLAKGTVVLNGASTLAADPLLRAKGTVVLAGVGTFTADYQGSSVGSASMAGTGTLAANPALIARTAVAVSGTGAAAFFGRGVFRSPSELNGSSMLATVVVMTRRVLSNLSGTGTVTGFSRLRTSGATALNGTGTIQPLGLIYKNGASAFSGAGTFASSGLVIRHVSSTLNGASTFSSVPTARFSGRAVASGVGAASFFSRALMRAANLFSAQGTLVADGFTFNIHLPVPASRKIPIPSEARTALAKSAGRRVVVARQGRSVLSSGDD